VQAAARPGEPDHLGDARGQPHTPEAISGATVRAFVYDLDGKVLSQTMKAGFSKGVTAH